MRLLPALLALSVALSSAAALDLDAEGYRIVQPGQTIWLVGRVQDQDWARVAAYLPNGELAVCFDTRITLIGKDELLLDGANAPVWGPMTPQWSPDSFILRANDRVGHKAFDALGNENRVEAEEMNLKDRLLAPLMGGVPLAKLPASAIPKPAKPQKPAAPRVESEPIEEDGAPAAVPPVPRPGPAPRPAKPGRQDDDAKPEGAKPDAAKPDAVKPGAPADAF